jgi:bifunctional enzyme CysN/CysC
MPLRMPVQDVYKFSEDGDQRRIVAGTLASGRIHPGDSLVAYPSGKRTHVAELVAFNHNSLTQADAGEAIGFTMQEQIYLRRGEIICRADEPAPKVSTRLRTSLFWIGEQPLRVGQDYLLKAGTAKEIARVEAIHQVLDAATYDMVENLDEVSRHMAGEVTLKTRHPIVFDVGTKLPETSRFVLVDGYEIAGGGKILETLPDEDMRLREEVYQRDQKWVQGILTANQRAQRFNQQPALIIITGEKGAGRKRLAAHLEQRLFAEGSLVYYLGIGSVIHGVNFDLTNRTNPEEWTEHVRRFAEVCHLLLDTGLILIVTAIELTSVDVKILKTIINTEIIQTIWLGDKITTDLVPDTHLSNNEDEEVHLARIKNGIEASGVVNGTHALD